MSIDQDQEMGSKRNLLKGKKFIYPGWLVGWFAADDLLG